MMPFVIHISELTSDEKMWKTNEKNTAEYGNYLRGGG